MKNLDIFKHDDPDGKYAISCFADCGPIFGFDDMGVFFYTGHAIDSKTESFSGACSYP